ncbi:Tryptophan--tRNA ligase, mitochondrial [Lecanora helva]
MEGKLVTLTVSMSLARSDRKQSKLALSDQVSALDSPVAKRQLKLGLFSYPVLQAADILLYNLFLQTWDLSSSSLAPAKRVMSLTEPHLKMSKSHQDSRSRIHINDTPDIISSKIKGAMTDSLTGITFDPVNRPGVSNLLALMSSFDFHDRPAEELARAYHAMDLREIKSIAASNISNGLASIREDYNRLLSANATQYLDDIAVQGSLKAQLLAENTMSTVRSMIGL